MPVRFAVQLLLISSILCLGAFLSLMRRDNRSGRDFLLAALLSTALWALFEALLFMDFSPEVKFTLTRIQYTWIVPVPAAILFYILEYTGHDEYVRPRYLISAMIVPAATLLVVWTNDCHHLMWTGFDVVGIGNIRALSLSYGIFFWAYAAYMYLLILFSLVLAVMKALRSSRTFVIQYLILILAVLVPLISNILYVYELIPLRPLDVTPIAFSISILLFFIGYSFFGLHDLIPIARDRIFENLANGILVIDYQGKINYINRRFHELKEAGFHDLIGKDVSELEAVYPGLKSLCRNPGETNQIWNADKADIYDISFTDLKNRRGRFIGRILEFRDITYLKRIESKLTELATVDGLTGLSNRGHFMSRCQKEIDRCLRTSRSFSFLMIDLDHFKRINDSYGHQTGDQILKNFGSLCLDSGRSSDLSGRLGGEEFALLLPETSLEAAAAFGARFLEKIRGCRVKTDQGEAVGYTVSMGIAAYRKGETLDQLISRADRAMYRAKESGRDRLTLESETEI